MTTQGNNRESRGAEPIAVRVPAGAPPWVTTELIGHTLRVWQPYSKQELTSEDALEIILSAGRLVDYLMLDEGANAG